MSGGTATGTRSRRPSSDGKLIGFVVGKYFELGPDKRPDFNGIDRNIREAVNWSRALIRAGFPVFTPHLNTFHFEMRTRIDPDPVQNEEFYRAFDRRLLSEAMDFVFATPNWRQSSGGRLEVQLACHLGIPVFETVPDLKAWHNGDTGYRTVQCGEISEEALNFGAKNVPIVLLQGRDGYGRSADASDLDALIDNELRTEQMAVALFNNRIAAFTPQMNNSVRRLGLSRAGLFASLTQAILDRVADALVLVPDGQDADARALVRSAENSGKPVFSTLEDVIAWRDSFLSSVSSG